MPMFQYICGKGHITEDICPYSEKQKVMDCEECGAEAEESFSRRPVTGNVETPRVSLAMGVHPDQIEMAMKKWPGSRYRADGALKIQNRTEKKNRLKQRNYIEYD